jgi:hypothetical protein
LAGTIESPKVTPGKGVPSFGAPATASGAAPSGVPAAPTSPQSIQNDVNSLKGLFNKKK